MNTPKPIKRHPALVSFSKEHHQALLLVWKIKEGFRLSVEPERISRYAVYFFDSDLIFHFADEEKILFPHLAAENPLKKRTEEEHKEIRNLIELLRKKDYDKTNVMNLATAIEKHVRFEERELFNFIQDNLSAENLTLIELSERRAGKDADAYWSDHFWTVNKTGFECK